MQESESPLHVAHRAVTVLVDAILHAIAAKGRELGNVHAAKESVEGLDRIQTVLPAAQSSLQVLRAELLPKNLPKWIRNLAGGTNKSAHQAAVSLGLLIDKILQDADGVHRDAKLDAPPTDYFEVRLPPSPFERRVRALESAGAALHRRDVHRIEYLSNKLAVQPSNVEQLKRVIEKEMHRSASRALNAMEADILEYLIKHSPVLALKNIDVGITYNTVRWHVANLKKRPAAIESTDSGLQVTWVGLASLRRAGRHD